MSSDRSWMHRAFPTLPPLEAEAIVAGLDDKAWHGLLELMEAPDPDGVHRALAKAYSAIIGDLMASATRKVEPHKRRWLIWHLSGGDIARRGLGLTVTRWLDANAAQCPTFGFPSGERNRKRRSAIVKELLADMRANVKEGGRPYTLSKADEDQLDIFMSFEDLDKK